MARIYPFRALRYNLARVSAADVVTQPYDRITPAMQQAYYQRSPWNLVRIVLRQPELFDRDGDWYSGAARDFAAWRQEGILAQEREPCVFAYAQRFALPGKPGAMRERRGFIALGDLYDDRQGVVFRRQQTLAEPVSDRLKLLRATRANFGQIFMLYSDPARTAEQLLFGSGADEATLPDIEAADEYGVVHRVWKVSDPGRIGLLAAALEDKKLIVAEGHHRYETALAYAQERAPRKSAEPCERRIAGLPQAAWPEAAAMMTFVNMDSGGLEILPTHRVVYGLEGFTAAKFAEAARRYFTVEKLPARDGAAAMERLANFREAAAFVAVTRAGWYWLTAKPAAAEALGGVPARLRPLDVVQLHKLLLEEILGIVPDAQGEDRNLRYTREAADAVDQVEREMANVAFLMNPVTLGQLREAAFAGETMPRHSTDFYPKMLSGLAIYALD